MIDDYRRIFSGIGWPYADQPGFIVVLGEDKKKDHSLPYSPRHYRVLAEAESSDIEQLRRDGLRYQDDYKIKRMFGNPENPIYILWRRRYGSDVVNLMLPADHEEITLNLLTQLIKRNTQVRKTLHFGAESRLPGSLMALMEERVDMDQLEKYPALTALSYPLVQMELRAAPKGEPFTPNRSKNKF